VHEQALKDVVELGISHYSDVRWDVLLIRVRERERVKRRERKGEKERERERRSHQENLYPARNALLVEAHALSGGCSRTGAKGCGGAGDVPLH
jgi:hypothetical protein